MLLFALDDVHWMVVMWIANRNSLLATMPTLIGLLIHLRAREDQKGNAWLALPFFALGLSAGETAIGALAYLGAYELFGAEGGKKMAAEYSMDYLGALPLDIQIRLQADSGKPTVVADPDGEVAGIYKAVARQVAIKIAAKAKDFSSKFPAIKISKDT